MGVSDEEENIWKQILGEVSAHSTKPKPRRLIVLGNSGSGKTSLVSKLKGPGEDELRLGAGLEYTYINVHDEEKDDYAKLGVWLQDGSPQQKELLKYALTKESVDKLLILICIDMSQPWNILETLEYWINIVNEFVHKLELTAKELNQLERKLIKDFQQYKDLSGESEEELNSNKAATKNTTDNEDESLMPLNENILINNTAVPIIVAMTKCDSISTLEKDYEYNDEMFDFIQKHLRKFCLKCGASLVYTSSRDSCNISTLFKYIIHRLYGFKFNIPPQIVEKDAIFVPLGWDNDNKIAILNEHIKTFSSDDEFHEHITNPSIRKMTSQEREKHAEDEQTFLEAQLVILNKAPQSTPSQRQPQQGERRSSGMSPGQRPNPRGSIPTAKAKIDPAKAAAAQGSSETVLANFFNSLLNKNTAGKSAKGTGNPVTSRSDVQAELERMSKKSSKKESAA